MMNTSQTDRTHNLEQGPVTVQAFQSFARQQAEFIQRTVADVSGRGAIESHYNHRGYRSILLSLAEPGRESPIDIVSGTSGNIEVSTMREDTFRQLGRCVTIGQAAVRLREAWPMSPTNVVVSGGGNTFIGDKNWRSALAEVRVATCP